MSECECVCVCVSVVAVVVAVLMVAALIAGRNEINKQHKVLKLKLFKPAQANRRWTLLPR